MTTPALTRVVGRTERTMRALLERVLDEAGLSFSEWTVLVSVDAAGPLTLEELVGRQVDGRVAPEAEARVAVEGLLSRGLLAPVGGTRGASQDSENPRLVSRPAAEAVYRPARRAVDRIADGLFADLPLADLEATHRTLAEVTRRANARLAAGG